MAQILLGETHPLNFFCALLVLIKSASVISTVVGTVASLYIDGTLEMFFSTTFILCYNKV